MSDANNEDIVITITDVEATETAVEQEPEGQETNKGEKRKREVKVRSKVWAHFTKISPKEEECTYNYCKKVFSCRSKGGTTHLHRHIFGGICVAYKRPMGRQSSKGQTLLSFPKGTSSNTSSTAKKNYMDDFYSLDEEEDSTCSKTELDSYLEEKIYPSKADEEESFNLLDYWRTHAAKFPILSMMARDILAIPVSSIASESAFNTGGRVLNKFRSSLLPSTVEALICAQDWIKDAPKEIDFEQEFDPDFTAPPPSKS